MTQTITLRVHVLPGVELPDADTDVLIWIKGETEATLGAYVGHSGDLAIWVDAQGGPCEVDAWGELPKIERYTQAELDAAAARAAESAASLRVE